jgi:hypothetical protein
MALNTRPVLTLTDLENALLDAETQPISLIRIDSDLIQINTTLLLPKVLNTPGKHLIIEGNGCTIQAAVAGVGAPTHLMKVKDPIDQADANNMLQNRFTIRNITFNGRASNLTCLELTATEQSEIYGCKFISATYGVKLQYAPYTRIIKSIARGISAVSFDVNKLLTVPNNNLFGSSYTRIENCSSTTELNGQISAISVLASGGCVISQFISKGKSPQHHINFDSNGYSGANNIMMDNIFIGINATTSAIKLAMFGGYAKISGITNNFDQILIEASNQNTNILDTLPRVYLEHYPVITPFTQFKTGGSCSSGDVIWSFFDVDQGRTIWQAARWDNGVVPVYRYSEYFQSPTNSKEIVTNSMKVNNNIIS